jgi:hypothetical protein
VIDPPKSLIRFFSKKEHALQFIAGQIRFGLLNYYRTAEGKRQDTEEGSVAFYWNKKAPQIVFDTETGLVVSQGESDRNIHYRGSSLNPYFILCTSQPDVDKVILAERFGEFIVHINDSRVLLERIKVAWKAHPWALGDSAFIAPVVYNKHEIIEADPYLIVPPQYAYSQKPPSFQNERESRFVIKCSVDTKRHLSDFLILSVPDCIDILSLLP